MMSAIFGWMGGHATQDQQSAYLHAMTGVRGDAAALRPTLNSSSSAAIFSVDGLVPVSQQQQGDLLVALQGRVHWKLDELSRLAAGHGDTAAAARAYERYGEDCLQQMYGPFALVISDSAHRRGLIAVDRMGVRTMCYASPPGQLVFGSTADRVATHPKVGRELSRQAIFNYLYCHVVPSPGTIYREIRKLQPAECVIFKDGVPTRRFYWQLRHIDRSNESFDALRDRFHRLLREAVKRTVNEDHDIGAFLSGGTDSSTVTGLLSELRGTPAKTYSIGFAAEGFDEMAYARITARHFDADAHEYYLTPQDVVDAIPLIAQAYDEPFGNDSAVPVYFCAKMAQADGIKIMLAGDGGDEIFGGNIRYAKQKLFEVYWSLPGPLRQRVIEPLTLRIPRADKLPLVSKLRSYVRQASVPLPDRLETYNFLHRSPLSDVLEPDFLAEVDLMEPLELLRDAYRRPTSSSAVNRMMHLDLKFTLADNDLRKVSGMCELAGIEARYPLLDDALAEFSGELPASLKVRGLKLRYFFKEALKDFLPLETIAKRKHGFGMPFGVWMKTHKPLRDLAIGSLENFQHRGIVRPSYIKRLLHEHDTGHATYFGIMIWVIMMLERWLVARNL